MTETVTVPKEWYEETLIDLRNYEVVMNVISDMPFSLEDWIEDWDFKTGMPKTEEDYEEDS